MARSPWRKETSMAAGRCFACRAPEARFIFGVRNSSGKGSHIPMNRIESVLLAALLWGGLSGPAVFGQQPAPPAPPAPPRPAPAPRASRLGVPTAPSSVLRVGGGDTAA